MRRIDNVQSLRKDLDKRLTLFEREARHAVATSATTLEQRMAALASFRVTVYENTNQLQHAFLIIRAIEWLIQTERGREVVDWYWHPSSAGGANEPDLQGLCETGAPLVSAEVTTSPRPIGVIDSRMARTLGKLATMPGKLFYFVASAEMEKRATTKVRKAGHTIKVVCL